MGFFIDAYDLCCISLCTNLLRLIYYRVDGAAKPAGSLPPSASAVVNGVELCGTMAGQNFFMDGLVTSWAEREFVV
nr:putative inorganic phosphate transporter 1-7 [Quercus suber]